MTKVEMHKQICMGLNELYAKKNHDYGDSFHQTFVEEGLAMSRIRLGDKFSRFKTLSRSTDQKVNDESIRDTLLDLANYAIMTVLEMDLEKIGSSVNQKTGSHAGSSVNEQTDTETIASLDQTIQKATDAANKVLRDMGWAVSTIGIMYAGDQQTDTECGGSSVSEETDTDKRKELF